MAQKRTMVTLRLKIEINTREHFTIHGFQQHPFAIKSRWFTGNTTILTYSLEELLGTKLRALYQRKKDETCLIFGIPSTKQISRPIPD